MHVCSAEAIVSSAPLSTGSPILSLCAVLKGPGSRAIRASAATPRMQAVNCPGGECTWTAKDFQEIGILSDFISCYCRITSGDFVSRVSVCDRVSQPRGQNLRVNREMGLTCYPKFDQEAIRTCSLCADRKGIL